MIAPRVTAVLLALAASASQGANEDELTLETLMRGMASTTGVIAEFREVKQLALLSAPLETRGSIYFIPPDRLSRTTDSPGRTRLLINGERLEFSDEAGGTQFDLSSNPMAREFVDNFIVLWNGDLLELRRRYEIKFTARAARWELVLLPRDTRVRRLIRSITLSGRGRSLEEMVMIESDDDSTRTTFGKVEIDHRFSKAELERYFSTTSARKAP